MFFRRILLALFCLPLLFSVCNLNSYIQPQYARNNWNKNKENNIFCSLQNCNVSTAGGNKERARAVYSIVECFVLVTFPLKYELRNANLKFQKLL